jgi:hypothetical protein
MLLKVNQSDFMHSTADPDFAHPRRRPANFACDNFESRQVSGNKKSSGDRIDILGFPLEICSAVESGHAKTGMPIWIWPLKTKTNKAQML